MSFGLGVLRLSPQDFWAMTPRELAAAAGHLARPGDAPPSRGRLDEMMRAYPDRKIENRDVRNGGHD